MTTCLHCGYDPDCDHAVLVEINGQPQRIVTALDVIQDLDDVRTTIMTIVCVESKGTVLPKQPLTEAEAEQPH